MYIHKYHIRHTILTIIPQYTIHISYNIWICILYIYYILYAIYLYVSIYYVFNIIYGYIHVLHNKYIYLI